MVKAGEKTSMNKHINVLSIDLESWIHKYFINQRSSTKKTMDKGYIWKATQDILNILDSNGIRTTFFVVGEIFEWYPELIYMMKEKGHEINFHTYSHKKLLKEEHLLDELKKGKKFIEEFNIKGFRAPEAVIQKNHLKILKDWGFSYDSSIYSAFKIVEPIDGLLEIPISSYPLYKQKLNIKFPRNLNLPLLIHEIPFGSGYFIGLLGSNVQWFINRCNRKDIPVNMFMHPWQIVTPPGINKNIGVFMNLATPPSINKNILGVFMDHIKMIPYEINRRDTFNYLCRNYNFLPMKDLLYDNGWKI